MDLIAILPTYIDYNDFFVTLRLHLEKIDFISEILDITDVKVPILKMKVSGYYVDLLYATMERLNTSITKALKDETFFN